MNATTLAIYAFSGLIGGGIGLAFQEPPPETRKKIVVFLGVSLCTGFCFGGMVQDFVRIMVAMFTSTPLGVGVHEWAAGCTAGFCGWRFWQAVDKTAKRQSDAGLESVLVKIWNWRKPSEPAPAPAPPPQTAPPPTLPVPPALQPPVQSPATTADGLPPLPAPVFPPLPDGHAGG